MINFTKSLLADLRDAGFRYFGLEALTNCQTAPAGMPCDTALNQRGYPWYSFASGTYVREPQMSRLIREALNLGFEVFSYEKFGEKRDSFQAKYIADILKKDPKGKILVHCGFGHNIEEVDPETAIHGGRLMGYELKRMTGINPLTINQYVLSEAAPGRETGLYQIINEPEPSVFVDQEGKAFSGWSGTDNLFDMLVFHPRTQYVCGRPVWLINEPENRLFFLEKQKIAIDYPLIIKVWPAGEPREAAPIEVIEQEDHSKITPLVLSPGKYQLLLENPQGAQQQLQITIE